MKVVLVTLYMIIITDKSREAVKFNRFSMNIQVIRNGYLNGCPLENSYLIPSPYLITSPTMNHTFEPEINTKLICVIYMF